MRSAGTALLNGMDFVASSPNAVVYMVSIFLRASAGVMITLVFAGPLISLSQE